ncbi:hypothetical protein [Stenotrophomonas sp. GZD-301]|uniref:hypothetical protein n=1 Tax=Stenotrophomonas sp. GZD-301 TaxID=3404814 RepID=UPI003BB6DC76
MNTDPMAWVKLLAVLGVCAVVVGGSIWLLVWVFQRNARLEAERQRKAAAKQPPGA